MKVAHLAIASDLFGNRDEEAALILSAKDGNRAAFGELYDRYARMVHAIALAYLPHQEAEDLVQDVFVRALERLMGLQSPAAFGGWLCAIARHAALDQLRKRKAFTELAPEYRAKNGREIEALTVLAEIQHLPESYRETLIMRLVEGLTGPEIAAQTGLTPDSVRVNLHRGMKLLRKRLQVSS